MDKDLLRIVLCGAVDDGKSTLLGKLLCVAGKIPPDELDQCRGPEGEIDPSLLLDGLQVERESGVTIDVAYRYFSTPCRAFILADAPGHSEYTARMVVGASNAQLAILVVDATMGLKQQTRRHAALLSLLGIKHIILAVNKMDAVGYDKKPFDEISAAFRNYAESFLKTDIIAVIPVSARRGDNIGSDASRAMVWYHGPTLLSVLEQVPVKQERVHHPLRVVVQDGGDDKTGLYGHAVSGALKKNTLVKIMPTGKEARVIKIMPAALSLSSKTGADSAASGMAVRVILDSAITGDLLYAPDFPVTMSDRFTADLVWFGHTPLYAGRTYLLKINGRTVSASVTRAHYRLDTEMFVKMPALSVGMNDIAACDIITDTTVAFDVYEENTATGSFIIIDPHTRETLGAGMVRAPLQGAGVLSPPDVNRAARRALLGQKPAILWFTGLPCAGKTTIANRVDKKLHAMGRASYLLDGDYIRRGLNRDLGFTAADRVENIRRIGEVATLMADAGLIVLAAFISPFRSDRAQARTLAGDIPFIEIFVDTPLDVCRERDVKGLYKKAQAGEIENFTGISSPYESPEHPDLRLETVGHDPDDLAERVVKFLLKHTVAAV